MTAVEKFNLDMGMVLEVWGEGDGSCTWRVVSAISGQPFHNGIGPGVSRRGDSVIVHGEPPWQHIFTEDDFAAGELHRYPLTATVTYEVYGWEQPPEENQT